MQYIELPFGGPGRNPIFLFAQGNLGAEAIKKACAILKEEGSDEDVLMQRVKEVLGPKADTEQCAQLAQLAMYEAVTQNK